MKNKILIVDDVELNREFLKVILGDEYDIEEAFDGRQALEYLTVKGDTLDAMLLDIYMPGISGYDIITYMRQNGWLDKIPVLIISAEHSVEVENNFFSLGASDFIHKPFDASLVRSRVKNLVELYGYRNQLKKKVESQTVTLKNQYRLLNAQAVKLKESNDKIIEILGAVVEFRNLESGEHIKRVKGFTKLLAEQVMEQYPEYGLTNDKIHEIVVTSSLHDVGKITIPDKILLKPGKLTKDEFEYMQSHTIRGCDMLNSIEGIWTDEYRQTSYDICRYHHERYDGGGYPDHLKGDAIPISAQIVSIADVYDALISERVYKSAYDKDEAFHMIINGECGVFSPKLMECLRNVRAKFEALANDSQQSVG